jgi:hypothetical protein
MNVARVDLPSGALVPSPVEANLVDPEAVAAALTRLVEGLGCPRDRVTLLLPDGTARGIVFPAAAGVEPLEQARFRLAPGLPYPAREALVDVRVLGEGRLLGVAVRRHVVEGFEALAASIGLDIERVLLSPMAALEGLSRLPTGSDSVVDVILGDAAFSLAGRFGGALRVFRSRLREAGPGEADRLRDEVLRTATLAGEGVAPRVRIVGPGAAALVSALSSRGTRAEPGWQAEGVGFPRDPAEIPWLGMALP